MPKFLIPQLAKNIEQLGACMVVENANTEIIAWAKANETDEAVVKFVDDGEDRWLEWSVEYWERKEEKAVHLHLEVSRSELTATDSRDVSAEQVAALCDDFIRIIEGCEATVRVRGNSIKIPLDDLPDPGMVSQFFDSNKISLQKPFSIDGINLKIKDDLFTRLILDKEEDGVRAFLFSRKKMAVDCDTFQQLSVVIDRGICDFVFEDSQAELTA